MGVLGGWTFAYERGTPEAQTQSAGRSVPLALALSMSLPRSFLLSLLTLSRSRSRLVFSLSPSRSLSLFLVLSIERFFSMLKKERPIYFLKIYESSGPEIQGPIFEQWLHRHPDAGSSYTWSSKSVSTCSRGVSSELNSLNAKRVELSGCPESSASRISARLQ